MSDPTVREATDDDDAALAAVYRSAYREARELGFPMKAESATEVEVAGWMADASVYVAEAGGEVVGGVRVEETDPDRVKLSRLGVREDRKGEGVGGRLVGYAEDAAQADGHRIIWLTTPGEHPYLPEFYRARGYEETGTYPLEYREYDEVIMEKALR